MLRKVSQLSTYRERGHCSECSQGERSCNGRPSRSSIAWLLANWAHVVLLHHGACYCFMGLQGWVKSMRKKKELVFIDISDGSTANKLQVVISAELMRG